MCKRFGLELGTLLFELYSATLLDMVHAIHLFPNSDCALAMHTAIIKSCRVIRPHSQPAECETHLYPVLICFYGKSAPCCSQAFLFYPCRSTFNPSMLTFSIFYSVYLYKVVFFPVVLLNGNLKGSVERHFLKFSQYIISYCVDSTMFKKECTVFM